MSASAHQSVVHQRQESRPRGYAHHRRYELNADSAASRSLSGAEITDSAFAKSDCDICGASNSSHGDCASAIGGPIRLTTTTSMKHTSQSRLFGLMVMAAS